MDPKQPAGPAPPCANCTLPCRRSTGLDEGKAEVLKHLSLTRYATTKQDEVEIEIENQPITIAEAMDEIFGIKFRVLDTDDPGETIEKCLILCSRCDKHLSELYRLFLEFEEICKDDSYISTHIDHPVDPKSTLVSNNDDNELGIQIQNVESLEEKQVMDLYCL